ncbi:MAG: hypothetical protein JJ900_17925 [Rhodospirillales bacterium]|nr:hypothetical protein [Rhodospirillales bacterium]MBO6788730.1 hypothetical protein [Rhodospirillales bacterium]
MHIRSIRKFFDNERGGVAVYSAMFIVAALGSGALAVDIGRAAVLRNQLQNRADAGAMAGAAQLDGRIGAQARATAVAFNATQANSLMTSDPASLTVQSVNFYSEINPLTAATGDEDSKYVEVTMTPKKIDFILRRFMNNTLGDQSTQIPSRAVARSNPFICHAPPLMMCDPEEADPTFDLENPANVGRQVVLKPPLGGSAWGPGNYGLLALPDGSKGASDIENALASVQPQDCYTLDVSTATGVKTNKIQAGINARFDTQGDPYPAPNVINYPRDAEIVASTSTTMGSGTWDADGYWNARHGVSLPTELTGATRYQVYLYELGLEFARNGRETAYPLDSGVPAGYTLVTPPGENIPEDLSDPDNPDVDGVPSSTVASNGYARRIVEVAVLQCVSDNVQGSHTYPTNGNYVEMFVTEATPDEPAGGIFGEIIRPLSPNNDPDFHANVALVE